jgi:hypothetical protein
MRIQMIRLEKTNLLASLLIRPVHGPCCCMRCTASCSSSYKFSKYLNFFVQFSDAWCAQGLLPVCMVILWPTVSSLLI